MKVSKCTSCGTYKGTKAREGCEECRVYHNCLIHLSHFYSNGNSKGRPNGYILSDKIKSKIADTKTGQKHSEKTKQKISDSVIEYFRKKFPFSEELARKYRKDIKRG